MKKVFLLFGLTLLLSALLIALAVSDEVAKDPVCGMEINPATAKAKCEGKHGNLYFCSAECKNKFCANPTNFLAQEKLDELGITVPCACPDTKTAAAAAEAVEATGAKIPCAGCEHSKTAEATPTVAPVGDCSGECGKTKVTAVNDFHAVMSPVEFAMGSGDLEMAKKRSAALKSKRDAVMSAECPEGVCSEGFKAARTDFSAKVDAFVAACESGSDEEVHKAFAEMHKAYKVLDQLAR
ncbi:MAG: YHS domain-containing protein [bacterium]